MVDVPPGLKAGALLAAQLADVALLPCEPIRAEAAELASAVWELL